tara:strand:- start:4861 stop:5607 length:747 start_codon:yes stop_codon:yes gene_type:complete
MAVTRYDTVNTIVNRAAVEVGLTSIPDVFAGGDPAFAQLTGLLTSGLQTLMEDYVWNILIRTFQYTTAGGADSVVPLPDAFAYMIPQTGWERSENVPLLGPLSSQEWTYLLGRDLVSSTIYASFRFDQGSFYIFPNDPVPIGLDINFEYMSRNLIKIATAPTTYTDVAATAEDIVQLPANLVVKQLKMLFLEAKGFDSTKATDAFNLALQSWMGKDNSAPILNTRGGRGAYPYLNGFRNTPDTGYGGA